MLRTVRLQFADRPDYELALESTDDDANPRELVAAHADDDGRIPLGDRDSCALEDIVEATFVGPKRLQGPTWEHGLQDEDVATALDEGYEPPT